MKRYLLSSCMFVTAALLSACQHAHQEKAVNVPVNNSIDQTPIHEEYKDGRVAFSVNQSPIEEGKIFMRKNTNEEWTAPPREVDLLKERLATIQSEVSERDAEFQVSLEQKFKRFESMLLDMKNNEMAQASRDQQRQQSIEKKFDAFADALMRMKQEELEKAKQHEHFIVSLDNKLNSVEQKLSQTDIEKQQLEAELYRRTKELEGILQQARSENTLLGSKLLEVERDVQDKKEKLQEEFGVKYALLEQKLETERAEKRAIKAELEGQLEDVKDQLVIESTSLRSDVANRYAQVQEKLSEQSNKQVTSESALEMLDQKLGLLDDRLTQEQREKKMLEADFAKRVAEIENNIAYVQAGTADRIKQLESRREVIEQRLDLVTSADRLSRKALEAQRMEIQQQIDKIAQDDEVRIHELEAKRRQAEQELQAELAALRVEQEQKELLAKARAEAVEEGRKQRFMEELEFRQALQETRRKQIMEEAAQAEQERLAMLQREQEFQAKMEQKRQELESEIVSLNQELETVQTESDRKIAEEKRRRLNMESALTRRLTDLQRDYDMKVMELHEQKADLSKQIADLTFDDQVTREQLELQRIDLEFEIARMAEEYERRQQETEAYQRAIEDKIFAMEASTAQAWSSDALDIKWNDEKPSMVENESIREADITVASAVIEPSTSDVQIDKNLSGTSNPASWIELKDYDVVVHSDQETLEGIINKIISQAEPYVGPWQVKWKLNRNNQDVLTERFSLDAETDFETFASYISNFMMGYRGFGLSFNIFEDERILVITD